MTKFTTYLSIRGMSLLMSLVLWLPMAHSFNEVIVPERIVLSHSDILDSVLLDAAQQEFEPQDAMPIDTSRFLPWSLTVWGQHRSNTMDHQLGQLLVRGGNIDRTLVDAARIAQGSDMGAFGFSSGFQLHARSRHLWRERDWRICGSVQARWIGDSRWTPEMYDLVLTGNAGHLGRWDVLDGSRARTAAWLNAAVGIEGKHQNRVELGLVYRPFQFEGLIETGYFQVNEAIDDF